MKRLVNGMVAATFPLSGGLAAFEMARSKGALKVQFVMGESQQEPDTARIEEQPADGGALAGAIGTQPPDEPMPDDAYAG